MHNPYVLKDGRGDFDVDSRIMVVATRLPDGPPDKDRWVIGVFHQ